MRLTAELLAALEAELVRTERALRRAAGTQNTALAARNEAVTQALAWGMTHAQIARLTGLSRGRIGQLAMTQPPAAETPAPTGPDDPRGE